MTDKVYVPLLMPGLVKPVFIMKDSHKLIFFSVLAVVALWTIDALFDSYIFFSEPFLDSLINISPHELYFRLFFIGGFIIFDVITLRILFKKKKLEEFILLAKKDWEEAFDTITDAITVHDKDFNIVRANKAAEKLLVSPFSEIINKKKCYELFHGETAPPERCPSCEVITTGKPAFFEIFEPHLNKYIEIRAIPRFNKDKQLAGIIHVTRDFTERKQIEEALIKSDERYRAFIDSTKDIFILKDEQFRYLIVNSACCESFGKKVEEIIEKTDFELMPETIAETCRQSDIKVLESEDTVISEEIAGSRIFETRKFRIKLKNNKFGIGAHLRDITEQKQAEKELKRYKEHLEELVKMRTSELLETNLQLNREIIERKNMEQEAFRTSHLASIGELAAGVAHEINNPINGIINYAQILTNNSKEGNQDYDISKRILKESNRIEGIVKGLLTFARGNKEEKTSVSIHNIINDAIALIGYQLQKDGINLVVKVSENLPEILANQNQLEQVVLNIISNSRYALNQKNTAPYNGKCIEITGEMTGDRENQSILLTFYDNGTGIPLSIKDKIMNPFFSTKPTGVGTGLGLSISYGIIKDHDGRLTINSEEGDYTKVAVELPVKSVAS